MQTSKDCTIRVRIDKDLDQKFKLLCSNARQNPSEVVRRLISLYVDNHPNPSNIIDIEFHITSWPKENKHHRYCFNIDLNVLGLEESELKEEIMFLLPEFFDEYNQELYRVDSAYTHKSSFPNNTGVKGRFLGAKLTNDKWHWSGAIFIYSDSLLNTTDICFDNVKQKLKDRIIDAIIGHRNAKISIEHDEKTIEAIRSSTESATTDSL